MSRMGQPARFWTVGLFLLFLILVVPRIVAWLLT
jgi:hypothetical protein